MWFGFACKRMSYKAFKGMSYHFNRYYMSAPPLTKVDMRLKMCYNISVGPEKLDLADVGCCRLHCHYDAGQKRLASDEVRCSRRQPRISEASDGEHSQAVLSYPEASADGWLRKSGGCDEPS